MSKEKKDSKWPLLPSILIILTALLPTTIGVFFFHSSLPKQESPGEFDWKPPPSLPRDFERPNQTPPENVPPSENITPPQDLQNLSQIPTFLVKNTDKAPNFGWRLNALDYYTSDEFTTSNGSRANIENYEGTSGTEPQEVKAINLTSNTSNSLVYLQKPEAPPPVDQLQIKDGASNETLFLYQLNVTNDLIAYGTTERNRFNASYQTYTTRLDRNEIERNSASIKETNNTANTNETLKNYFLQLPGGRDDYLNNNSQVEEFVNEVRLNESKTVYSQVQAIGNMLTLNFSISNATAPNDTDAVSWFLGQKEGPPSYFSYTLAVTLRALGIPSRIVVGFLGGVSKDGFTYLSQANLGTWVEVYDAGNGWTPYCSYLSLLRQNFTNIINCGVRLYMKADTPHETDGIKWVYYNETFTLSLSVTGEGLTLLYGEPVRFYDYNVSNITHFNQSELSFGTDEESLIASIHTSFLLINNSSELTINEYGIHILASRLMRQVRAVEVALVQRSEIK